MTHYGLESKFLPSWFPLYRVEEVLTKSNLVSRKVATIYIKCVHGIKLLPVIPQRCADDLTVINFDNFPRCLSVGHIRVEPTLFGESLPFVFVHPTTRVPTRTVTWDLTPVTHSVSFPIDLPSVRSR